jgi:FlgD Ig-like domain
MSLHRFLRIFLLTLPTFAWAQVSLQTMSSAELSSTAGGQVVYTVRTTQVGDVTLEILSGDGDVVRRMSGRAASAGDVNITWDGKDERKQPVPDEAYCARVTLSSGDATFVDDPCTRTGGEVLSGLQPLMANNGDIVYTLQHPARVMTRVGVKNGAMFRSLSVWRARPAGRNLHRWNGMDESGLVSLRNDRIALLVAAFRLPDFTVITTGNEALEYRSWRKAQGWTEKPDAAVGEKSTQPLERNGLRIARQHYMPRYKDIDPRIEVKLLDANGKSLSDGATVPDVVRILVDLHEEDRWLMQEQLYEVGFFVNGDFVSEEENGYVPIGWLWNTANLKPGQHLLTVNLTGFSGRVGARTIAVRK